MGFKRRVGLKESDVPAERRRGKDGQGETTVGRDLDFAGAVRKEEEKKKLLC